MHPGIFYPATLVGNLPQGRIEVSIERAEMAPERLFTFATRNNPKRAFLFLSHVLGKHLPVPPALMAEVHERIAAHIPDLPEPILFVGMAETATCLGQGVFEAWLRDHPGKQALFLHTTRYDVAGASPIVFEESHSHAPMGLLRFVWNECHLSKWRGR
ncbi:MAG TPA: phosphoribosyltransferase domain-containing protein, partial [Nitrospira sp.]|nr:phosphoribosyltransferase domain-containing protein [Nitrospira sp.]